MSKPSLFHMFFPLKVWLNPRYESQFLVGIIEESPKILRVWHPFLGEISTTSELPTIKYSEWRTSWGFCWKILGCYLSIWWCFNVFPWEQNYVIMSWFSTPGVDDFSWFVFGGTKKRWPTSWGHRAFGESGGSTLPWQMVKVKASRSRWWHETNEIGGFVALFFGSWDGWLIGNSEKKKRSPW